MADAKTIQRLPVGLLDLLGMQSTGDTPHLISGEVVPMINLLDLYLTDRLRGANITTANVTAIGGLNTTLGPPAGEQWMCYGMVATSSNALAAATAYTGNILLRRVSTGYSQFLTLPYAVANPALFCTSVNFSQPLIMRPGDTMGIWISAITGAPASSIDLTCIYVPIRV